MSDYKERACTCHPDEAPRPCPQRYAYSECVLAAENERLRAANERLREELSDFVWGWRDTAFEAGDEIERLRAENERLRHDLAYEMGKPWKAK